MTNLNLLILPASFSHRHQSVTELVKLYANRLKTFSASSASLDMVSISRPAKLVPKCLCAEGSLPVLANVS